MGGTFILRTEGQIQFSHMKNERNFFSERGNNTHDGKKELIVVKILEDSFINVFNKDVWRA